MTPDKIQNLVYEWVGFKIFLAKNLLILVKMWRQNGKISIQVGHSLDPVVNIHFQKMNE